MGTYEQGRDRQHLASLYAAIDDFITRYNANPSTERRRTIFLFPGGMGSQLMRATTDSSGGPSFFYDVIWLNCSSLTGAATKLRMQGSVDYQKHYILPHGASISSRCGRTRISLGGARTTHSTFLCLVGIGGAT